jgi:GntR family transcriptional regulator
LPLYRQVYDLILKRIVSGHYVEGDKLPTEVKFASELGVSAITCRRALQDLAAEGYITRTPRKGSIVQRIPYSAALSASLDRLLDAVKVRRESADFEVLEFETVEAPAEIGAIFGETSDGLYLKSVVLIKRDGQTVAHLTTWTPEDLGKHVDENAISSTFGIVHMKESGINVTRAVQTIGGHPAPKDIAKKIGVKPGSSATKMTRTAYDDEDRVVEFVVAYSPWDQYEYRIIMD